MPKKQTVKTSRKSRTKTTAQKSVKTRTPVKKTTGKKPVKASVKTKATSRKLNERENMVQQIKKNLLDQKKSLLAGAMEALNELPGQTVFPDLGDQATAEIDRNFMLRLKGRERKLLKKIDEAVDRIDTGIFGICEKCGEEIDIRRLEARPVTTMCIECKTLQEEEEKMMEK
ncbi:MAG: RNA polymerase-binding protein DksA [Nitrospirota bacterium]